MNDASDAGNSSRTASTYAGMMPLKPRPNTAETVKSPASLWVDRKPTIATSWQTEPAKIVRRPPIRSATRPQICRLRKAKPSSIESIAAPTDAEIPTSVQRATRWPCGIAIGTQQQKPAAASIDNAIAGRNPSTGAAGRRPVAALSRRPLRAHFPPQTGRE